MNKDQALQSLQNQFGGVFDFVTEHPVLAIIAVIAALVVLLIIVRFAFRLLGSIRNKKEVASLKKDLMVWSMLSSLVHGGKKTDKAKAEINSKIAVVDGNFEHIESIIRAQTFLSEDRPCFLLLGEPSCGKSTLIENSDLEFKCSDVDKENTKQPVKFYYNNSAIIADVSGKVFFDSWLKGSSAEWSRICTMLRKKHYKKPLDGVILTISADSLLADDKQLTMRKAQLISDELVRLTGTIRMHIPVYIVITKLDMIVGFREYFQSLSDDAKDQIFGFQPLTNNGSYDSGDFNTFFDVLLERLQDGVVKLMGNKSVMELSYLERSRMELTGNMYLFADKFSNIRANLTTYLEIIFARPDVVGDLRPDFNGVYFSSARDDGICVDKRYAELQSKAIDDCLLVDPNFKQSRSYFIQDLLLNLILRPQAQATFFKAETLRRRMPVIVASTACCVLSVIYLVGAFYSAPKLQDLLEDDRLYLVDLGEKFANSTISGAPLLSTDYQGQGILMVNSVMPDNPRISRINYFSDTQARLLKQYSLPWTLFPASVVKFGLSMDIAKAHRYYLYNQLQTKMVFLPMVDSIEASFMQRRGERMTMAKRNALFRLLGANLFLNMNKSSVSNNIYEGSMVQGFLDYLYPQMGEKLRGQISLYEPKYDYSARTTNRIIVLDPAFHDSCAAGIQDLLSGWNSLTIYPGHEYSLFRKDLDIANSKRKVAQRLEEIRKVNIMNSSYEEFSKTVTQYRTLAGVFIRDLKNVDDMVKYATVQNTVATKDGAAAAQDGASGAGSDKKSEVTNQYYTVFETAYQSYRSYLNDDFSKLSKFGSDVKAVNNDTAVNTFKELDDGSLEQLKQSALAALQSEHDSLTQAISAIQQDPLFVSVDPKSSAPEFNYQVIGRLLENSIVSRQSQKQTSPDGFWEDAGSVDKEIEHRHEVLDEIISAYPNSQLVKQWGAFCSNYLDFQHTAIYIDMVHHLLSMFPDTDNEMNLLSDSMMMVSDYHSEGTEIGSEVSFDMVHEVLGDLEIRQEYQPEGFLAYANSLAVLRAYSLNKKYVYFRHILETSPKLSRLIRVFQKYAGNYINYWGHVAESVHPRADSYADFYNLVTNTRAYQVNSQLADLYDLSIDAISDLSDDLLDEKTSALKNNSLKTLKEKVKALDISFTDQCNDAVDAWAMLSGDATYANRQVMEMTDKEIKNSLQLMARSPFVWWRDFTNLGSRLLKRDASQEASTSVAMYQSDLKVFPLIKDGDPHRKVLSPDNMRSLMAMFKSFGLTAKSSDPKEPDELAGLDKDDQGRLRINQNLKAPLVFSEDSNTQGIYKSWSETMEQLLTILSNTDRNSYYKLMRVGAATQQRLAREQGLEGMETAMTRYRYFDVTIGKKSSEIMTSFVNAAEPQSIARGNLNNEKITFNFYRYSDSREPDCSYVIDGGYPGLQLYLNENAFYDEESKITYVPLEINDQGNKSLFYIGFSTAVKLPLANNWPSLSNWPNLNMFSDYSR